MEGEGRMEGGRGGEGEGRMEGEGGEERGRGGWRGLQVWLVDRLPEVKGGCGESGRGRGW